MRLENLFSLFLIQNICYGYSKHMFKLIGKEKIAILRLKICFSRPNVKSATYDKSELK